jgi:glucosamine-phosphate N-acetyltransferase
MIYGFSGMFTKKNNKNRSRKMSSSRRVTVLQNQIKPSTSSTTIQIDSNLVIRLLEENDYQKGFLSLLSQLSEVGDVTESQFVQRLREMKQCKDTYYIFVIEDLEKKRIVGCATLFIEVKFLHNCSSVGHIEDVVVDSSYRGKQLGQKIISACKQLSAEKGCYKVILDCAEKVVSFYEGCEFERKGALMRYDIH